jgi:sterol desaturase/sphingolipid hydroxylase (fatty acid hydroxylase superfamily)
MTDVHLVMWVAVGVMFSLFVIECVYSLWIRRDGHYTGWDTFTNLAIAFGYMISSLAIGTLITLLLLPFHELTPLRWSMEWWHWLVMFVVNDFFFYWSHRASHKLGIMWASHAVHHNSDRLNLSTGMRNSWVGAALDWVFFIPVVMLGFHPIFLFALVPLASGWDYLTHTPYVGKLPVLDGIFNTPANHRVHHERASGYTYKNLGGALIIWDRLFGTYASEPTGEQVPLGHEAEMTRPEYGVEPMPARPRNPFYLEFYLWGSLLRDTFRALRGARRATSM